MRKAKLGIHSIEREAERLKTLLGAVGGGWLPHNLLSALHVDTSAAAAVQGDIITGQAGPLWARLAIGAASTHLESDGIDVAWQANLTMADDTWIGFAAAGRLVFDSTPAPDQLQVTAADLYFATTAHGIIHIDGVAAGQFLRANGTRYIPDTLDVADITDLAYAAPNLTLGLANAAGAANTVIRTDATILAFDAVVPNVIECDDAAATGAATVAARRDHEHGIVCAAPGANLTVSTTNAEGAAVSFARSDHSHAITSSSNPGAAASILASDASGYLQLVGLGIGTAATAASSITFADDGWEGLGPAAGRLVWDSTAAPDTANFLNCDVAIGAAPLGLGNLEVIQATTATEVAISTFMTGGGNQDSRLYFVRSNTNTAGSYVETVDTQLLGEIEFYGVDTGSILSEGARIEAVQDGAAGNFIPTKLTLETYTNAGANTDQLVLTSNGNISISGNMILVDGATIGQAAGPLLTFDDTLNYLEIAGCSVGIGTPTPSYQVHATSHIKSDTFFILPAAAGFEWWMGAFTAVGPWQLTNRRIADGVWTNAITVNTSNNVGIQMTPTANGVLCLSLPTENCEIIDAGSAGATEQDWIEVEINSVQGYLRVFAAV